MTETIKSTIDSGRYGCGVCIDLQIIPFFENARTLWDKGTAVKWPTSYLIDRQQYVSVNGH